MSGSQLIIPRAENDGAHVEIEKELEQALLLVRVSTMKMLRLQLAIERRDRTVALQAVEDLMELDAWMAHSAGRSADDDLMDAMAEEADDQRGALLHEKFGLAAGLVKRPSRDWAGPEPEAEPLELVDPVFDEVPAAARSTRWWLVAAIMLLLIGAAVAAALWLQGG